MTDESKKKADTLESGLELNLRIAKFPSDALSIKRLRQTFPEHFDTPAPLLENHTNNNFFNPVGIEPPRHLVKLTELICHERTLAHGAFYRTLAERSPGYALEADEIELIENDKHALVENYQHFKLADSPEIARLLIRQCEEEGERQAREILKKSPHR